MYLKNRVSRAWAPSEDTSRDHRPIPEDEKDNLRRRLLPVLSSTPSQIRAQLIPLLHKILSTDFPSKWPDFLDITMHLLGTNDAGSVYAGLQCLLAICRLYRYKGAESRKEFNQIVEASFPQLLAIANRLVQEPGLEAWEMLHLLLKAYKHTIYVSQYLQMLISSMETIACLTGYEVRLASLFDGSRSDGSMVYLVLDSRRERPT